MSSINEASFTAACLLIISELIRCKDDLRFQMYSLEQLTSVKKQIQNEGQNDEDDDDDEEERFVDADKIQEKKEA